jgi:arylsulfatase A-like enzyme
MRGMALSWLFVVACTVHAAERPNVLVILVDDLGYGDLGCYGATDLHSPQIDQLVQQGMRFDRFYANCPVCSPTRASLLTGCYPELVGVPGVIRTHAEDSWGYLRPDATLLPQILSQSGYTTACIGKWHLGLDDASHPMNRGFDFFRGFLGDMMDDYYHHRRHEQNYMRDGHQVIDPEGHATELFTQWALEYLRQQTDSDQPFFLYLAYNAPHTPIQPPPDWIDRVRAREPGIDARRASLVALIEHLDENIGHVLSCLKDEGLDKNTLVVFTSDNGGQLNVGANNGPWRDGKQSVYEGGLLVPACVVWPDRITAGSRTEQPVITMDLFPTICEAAGISAPESIDGRSFLPTLLQQNQTIGERDLFFHRREGGSRYGGLTIQAIRRGRWKLLQNSPFQPQELYDLENDPAEINNVIDRHPNIYSQLNASLMKHIQRGGQVPWQAAP